MTGFPIKTIMSLVKVSPSYRIVNIDENIINITGNKAVNMLTPIPGICSSFKITGL